MRHLLTDQFEYRRPIGVIVARLGVRYDGDDRVGLYEITETCMGQSVAPSFRVVVDLESRYMPEASLIRQALHAFDAMKADRESRTQQTANDNTREAEA